MVVGSSPTLGAMNEEFDIIVSNSYEGEGTLDRRLSDVLAVARLPEDAVFTVMYLAEFVSSLPGMEIWGSTDEPLNDDLTELFEPFAFPEEAWRQALAFGSEFGVLKVRMFGDGGVLSVEVCSNYVALCVEHDDFVNAILAAISFNEVRVERPADDDLDAYEDDQVASLGIFGDWRRLAYSCIEAFTLWGDVPVNLMPTMHDCHNVYDLGDVREYPWLRDGEAVWGILRDAGLFSGDVRAAELKVDSALNLCMLGGNFELAEKIASLFNDES